MGRSADASEGKPATRADLVARARALGDIEVLVVGAGVNGCAVFRELCLNGVSCLLVDAEDFGAGATAASSRIAHGGLRYLETGQVRLVAEATIERNRLLRNAPHFVRPLLITIPLFSVWGGLLQSVGRLLGIDRPLRSRGLVLVKLGLVLYDLLGARQRTLPRHQVLWGRGVGWALPQLNPAARGIASYFDARITRTERLAWEMVRAGCAASPGSVALNHCRLEGATADAVTLRDEETGARLQVRPKLVVNACGAWIDQANRALEAWAGRLIGGTKGSHVMIENPALLAAMRGRCFSFDDGHGRMCVAYPVGDLVMLGSSDIRVDDPSEAICSDEEVAYFVESMKRVFPAIAISPAQIRYRFCGVRPLPYVAGGSTVNISRDHSVHHEPPRPGRPFPILSLIGGKWTTFRAFGEQVSDRVLAELGRARAVSTRDMPIGGGAGFPAGEAAQRRWIETVADATGVGRDRVADLLERYGTVAEEVAHFIASLDDEPLPAAAEYSEGEIRYLVRCERARTVEDIIYRRTGLAIDGRLNLPLLERVAAILADELARETGAAGTLSAERLLAPALARLGRENGVRLVPDHGAPGERAAHPAGAR